MSELKGNVIERLQFVESKQTDERGLIQELVNNLRKENARMNSELHDMEATFKEKQEKIGWFERKLNKWVKLFEESEKD